jgi:hypothetical protein
MAYIRLVARKEKPSVVQMRREKLQAKRTNNALVAD